ncbi:hypothetical protein H072_9340 [Dactylellina haptotyla CBS 200.50]|uniref:Helicase-associated domain-containing protein n=1 Tax=Dactylellina haptotyla (strain CBS 200.50) TaxID=1284197 RepID=S8A7C3_DACHA|nr:hypothetical protein H072_9340 [Dactylellina haptotyla CBS 200.50]
MEKIDKIAAQKAVDDNNITLWMSVTGNSARKLPAFLLDAGWADTGGIICCVHDDDMLSTGHDLFGYSISFEDTTSQRSKVVHVTTDLLIQGALVDPLLSRYSVLILQECHLRTIQIDVILGLLKKILKRRDDLRLLVSAATPECLDFISAYLPESRIISLETSTYPVDLHHTLSDIHNYMDTALETVLSSIGANSTGITAMFMPTQDGKRVYKELHGAPRFVESTAKLGFAFCLIDWMHLEHHILDSGTYDYVIVTSLPAELIARRVPVSTVIDSGFQELVFSRYGYAKMTKIVPVSQETANLRARIGGLTGSGKCFRLFTASTFEKLEKFELPEIWRLPLDHCILQLKSLGIDNTLRFDYPSPPPSAAVAEAMDRLALLGAIDSETRLTKPFGEQAAQLPLNPLHAMLLISSLEQGCFEQIATIIAVWLTKGEFFDHENSLPFIAQEGDALTWLNIYEGFVKAGPTRIAWCRKYSLDERRLSRAVHVRQQLLRILERRGIMAPKTELATSTTIRKCIAFVYKQNYASQAPDGSYRTANRSLTVKVHPSSVLYNRKGKWIVFEDTLENDGELFIKNLSTIEEEWMNS